MLDTRLPPSGLLDRAGERDVLERLVAGVRAGQSRVPVLRGDTAPTRFLVRAPAGTATSTHARTAKARSDDR